MFGQGRAGPRRGAASAGERLRQRPPRGGAAEGLGGHRAARGAGGALGAGKGEVGR